MTAVLKTERWVDRWNVQDLPSIRGIGAHDAGHKEQVVLGSPRALFMIAILVFILYHYAFFIKEKGI